MSERTEAMKEVLRSIVQEKLERSWDEGAVDVLETLVKAMDEYPEMTVADVRAACLKMVASLKEQWHCEEVGV